MLQPELFHILFFELRPDINSLFVILSYLCTVRVCCDAAVTTLAQQVRAVRALLTSMAVCIAGELLGSYCKILLLH